MKHHTKSLNASKWNMPPAKAGGRGGGGSRGLVKKKVRKKMMFRWAVNGPEVSITIHLPEGR
jgi:hypothetical protein